MTQRQFVFGGGLYAAIAAALHLAVAGRYDFFRDELYFIICGRHPAFGYVDQPPLIPLVAALTQVGGEHLFALRAISAIIAAAMVYVVCAFVRLFNGGRFAVAVAAIGAALTPFDLSMYSLFTTSVLDALTWTLVAYFIARALVLEDWNALRWCGLTIGIALEAKYSIEFYVGPLLVALAFFRSGRMLFRRPELYQGTLLATIIALPSIVWQALHGWPFAELIRAGANGKNVVASPIAFVMQQLLGNGPLLTFVMLAGVIAAFRFSPLRAVRALGVTFVAVFLIMEMLHAKDYYLAPVYPTMFVFGALAIEHIVRNVVVRAIGTTLVVASSLAIAPIVMPILDPPQLLAFTRAIGFAPKAQETGHQGALIPQMFGDQLGWREFVATMAHQYEALPLQERSRTAIITANYGEAAAIDFYGSALGLPPAVSGHNTYYLWGTHGFDGSSILRSNGNLERYRKICKSAAIVARFGVEFAVPEEKDAPIVLCRGLTPPLTQDWDRFRNYN